MEKAGSRSMFIASDEQAGLEKKGRVLLFSRQKRENPLAHLSNFWKIAPGRKFPLNFTIWCYHEKRSTPQFESGKRNARVERCRNQGGREIGLAEDVVQTCSLAKQGVSNAGKANETAHPPLVNPLET